MFLGRYPGHFESRTTHQGPMTAVLAFLATLLFRPLHLGHVFSRILPTDKILGGDMKRNGLNFVWFLFFLLAPFLLWADTVTVPTDASTAGPSLEKPTKTHARKHSSKRRHKKYAKPDQGTNAAQEDVTDQREVSQQANSSDKYPKSKK